MSGPRPGDDLAWVGVATATWAGALVAPATAVGANVLVVVVLAAVRRIGRARAGPRARGRLPGALALALAASIAASLLAVRSLEGLDPIPASEVTTVVALLTDPRPVAGGRLRFEARLLDHHPGSRVLGVVSTPAAQEVLGARLAGEQVRIRGRLEPFDHRSEWLDSRHLRARLEVDAVEAVGSAAPHAAAANGLRRLLDRGAASLSDEHRALLAGLTLGDDRAQPAALTADFRAAGMTHLLAVSGQNLVLLLTVAGPMLRRLRLWPRWLVSVGLVVGFAFVVRFEPSVTRAAAVAVVATWATTIGRPAGGFRYLCLAVVGLLLIDPLLVRSVGFRLSVAACVGVLALAPRLAVGIRGPAWFRDSLAVTVGAQLAVAPVLVPTFGPMPLAAVPANVVAVPVAGALMVWGIAAGLVAGIAGPPWAAVLHLPSAVGLTVLEWVAAAGASLPLGTVDLRHVVVSAVAAGSWWMGGRAPLGTGRRRVAAVLAGMLVVSVAVVPGRLGVPAGGIAAGRGATVWSDGAVAVVELGPSAEAEEVLEVLRARRVRVVALVVVVSGRREMDEVVMAIGSRFPVRSVMGPRPVDHPRWVVPAPGVVVRVAGFRVQVVRSTPTLVALVGWDGPGRANGARGAG